VTWILLAVKSGQFCPPPCHRLQFSRSESRERGDKPHGTPLVRRGQEEAAQFRRCPQGQGLTWQPQFPHLAERGSREVAPIRGRRQQLLQECHASRGVLGKPRGTDDLGEAFGRRHRPVEGWEVAECGGVRAVGTAWQGGVTIPPDGAYLRHRVVFTAVMTGWGKRTSSPSCQVTLVNPASSTT